MSQEVYVFENLMLHGSISCPQPYTPQLLTDLDNFERMRIDGVIYEAFEPGIASFADQLTTLVEIVENANAKAFLTVDKICDLLEEEPEPGTLVTQLLANLTNASCPTGSLPDGALD